MTDPTLVAMEEIAREAGALAQRMRAEPGALHTRIKGPMDSVTAADLAVEAQVRKRIEEVSPNAAILGEEGGHQGSGDECWIVDPIDGTVNFARGTANWAVSIARYDGRSLTHAVISAPDLNLVATARLGCGAWLNGRRVILSDQVATAPIVSLGNSPRSALDEYLMLIETLNGAGAQYRRYGAATIGFLGVLAGWFDAYHERALNIWDAAAGLLLIAEAGGTVRHDPLTEFLRQSSDVSVASPTLGAENARLIGL